MNYLALGDSYTIGEGVEKEHSFPNLLKERLSLDEVKIIAKSGWTTTDLIHAIENETITEDSYDLVSLLIGVNNQYQGKSRQLFLNELENLIQKALKFCKDKKNIFLISIPNYGFTPYGLKNRSYISSDLKWYNEQVLISAKKHGLIHHDITPISEQAFYKLTLLAPDSLHPSKEMYELWINEIAPFSKK